MAGVKYRPKKGEGTTREALAFVPSAIHVDHDRNSSRAPLYSVPDELRQYVGLKSGGLLSETFCFTLAEVEQRLSELQADGQISSVSVYMTRTMDVYLTEGYLRHAAYLLAEARGVLGTIPATKAKNKIAADRVAQPQSAEDWAAVADRNYSENATRKELSDVDKAYYIKRLMRPSTAQGQGLSKEQVAGKLSLSSRAIARYVQLLTLEPRTIMEVHTGALSMSKALKRASEKGEGTSRGARAGVPHAAARKRFSDSRSDHAEKTSFPTTITERELFLARLIAGDEIGAQEVVPADLLELVSTLSVTPPKRVKPRTAKKAPPKPGKKAPKS